MSSPDKDDVQVLPETHLPLIHLIVGGWSPTALHGRRMSFIQGVVTVPLKVRILAGAKTVQTTFCWYKQASLWILYSELSSTFGQRLYCDLLAVVSMTSSCYSHHPDSVLSVLSEVGDPVEIGIWGRFKLTHHLWMEKARRQRRCTNFHLLLHTYWY